MDYHLAIFITVMLARRLVWTIVSEVSSQTADLHTSLRCTSPSGSCEFMLLSVSSRCLRAAADLCSAMWF